MEVELSRLLVIHHDSKIRSNLVSLVRGRHDVEGRELLAGVKGLSARRPDLIVVGLDSKKEEGTRLLKYMRDNQLKIPVIVVASRGCGKYQPIAMRLGAKGFLEYPVESERLEAAIAEALQAQAAVAAGPPPITLEEQRTNLSVLESQFNKNMKCFAGKNQVYIQSIILGGRTSRPRVALKCNLRAEYGLEKDVYYEYIRDVCCGDPSRCPALRQFQAERESA
jgi:FixJ family two-component response regulator